MVLGQYWVVLFGTLWYWVNNGWDCSVLGGTGSEFSGSGWYLVMLRQCNLVLLGIKWTLLCLYMLKKVEIWSDVTIAGRTNERTNKER